MASELSPVSERHWCAYEFLILTAVRDANVGLARLVEDGEGEVLDIGLDLCVRKFATDETLRVEDRVVGVHGDLVLGGITDKTLGVGKGNIGRGGAVALVVGDDLDTVVLPDTDTPENFIVRTKCR